MNAKKGDWVQVRRTILPAGERAPQVPEDTAALPLEMWVKGFLLDDASEGEAATVETMSGRRVTGQMSAVAPGFAHGFGACVPELLAIQRQLKEFSGKGRSHG